AGEVDRAATSNDQIASCTLTSEPTRACAPKSSRRCGADIDPEGLNMKTIFSITCAATAFLAAGPALAFPFGPPPAPPALPSGGPPMGGFPGGGGFPAGPPQGFPSRSGFPQPPQRFPSGPGFPQGEPAPLRPPLKPFPPAQDFRTRLKPSPPEPAFPRARRRASAAARTAP